MGRLDGLGIVITRPLAAAEPLARELAREGARAHVFPALELEDVPGSPALDAALGALERASLAIFVSANAVERGLPRVRARGPWPAGAAVAAVGDATAEALRNSGFTRVISPRERHDSDGLLALPELQSDRVSGENVVLFRGEGGRERVRDVLEAREARVWHAECYRRVRPATDPAPLLQAWARGEVHAVSALSGETLRNFVELIGEAGAGRLAGTCLVVPHEAVAAHPDSRRFARVVVAPPGVEGLKSALSQLRVTP